jgi:hypothetical protein
MNTQDLLIQFNSETGIGLENQTLISKSRFESKKYLLWLEEKLIEKQEDEKKINELFY